MILFMNAQDLKKEKKPAYFDVFADVAKSNRGKMQYIYSDIEEGMK